MVSKCLAEVREIMPWHLVDLLKAAPTPLIIDVREPNEYEAMHIAGSINVPRGILESACEWGYEDTVPVLAAARQRPIIVVCRSGRRSALAAWTMQQLGYLDVVSLKSGLRGWNDYEEPLENGRGEIVDPEAADSFFLSRVRPDQLRPDARA
jgi:rhodanese-related sulfurtransferase